MASQQSLKSGDKSQDNNENALGKDTSSGSSDGRTTPISNAEISPETPDLDVQSERAKLAEFAAQIKYMQEKLDSLEHPKTKENGTKSGTVGDEKKGNKKEKDEDKEEKKSAEDKILSEEEKKGLSDPSKWRELFEYRREYKRDKEMTVVSEKDFHTASNGRIGLCLYRHFEKNEIDVILWSPFMVDHFRKAITGMNFERMNISGYVTISSPYIPLYHCLEDMRTQVESDKSADYWDRAQFNALYRLCTEGFVGKRYEDMRHNFVRDETNFLDLWALFKPGQLAVTASFGSEESILKVRSIKRSAPENIFDCMQLLGRRKEWTIECTAISWDSSKFREEPKSIKIKQFAGSKKITELEVYPLSYHRDGEQLRETLKERGRKWSKLVAGKVRVMFCDGSATPFLVSRQMPFMEPPLEPKHMHIKGRVVVDPLALSRAARSANLQTASDAMGKTVGSNSSQSDVFFSPNRAATQSFDSLADEDLCLCPPTLPVFTLDEQEWLNVAVEGLSEVEWEKEAFEKLVLQKDKKEMLRKVSQAHAIGANKRTDDVIGNKGKGLVMLFYGPPGVGKTLTAEALSELTQKPLYRLNLGVVSSMPNWELHLDHVFNCAHAWNAILLIDEAEVVLEERTIHGRSQNTWVSVFLRKVEYYSGILILTTNLIRAVDEAFRSRVSLAVRYPPLNRFARRQVWELFVAKMNSRMANTDELLNHVDEWAGAELNARQIRNVIKTAESLVLGKSSFAKLEADDIENVMEHTVTFINSFQSDTEAKKNLVLRPTGLEERSLLPGALWCEQFMNFNTRGGGDIVYATAEATEAQVLNNEESVFRAVPARRHFEGGNYRPTSPRRPRRRSGGIK